jgi:hypothetical protein
MEILNDREFEALDYHMTYAKLYDSGLYIKQEPNRGDYFVDEQCDCEYSLEEGLKLIAETMSGNICDYSDYPSDILRGLCRLFIKRLGIYIWDRGFDLREDM